MKKVIAKNSKIGVLLKDLKCDAILVFKFLSVSIICAFENKNIVKNEIREIRKKPNFQYSEYWLAIKDPKTTFTTNIPTIKAASTLFIVLARDF